MKKVAGALSFYRYYTWEELHASITKCHLHEKAKQQCIGIESRKCLDVFGQDLLVSSKVGHPKMAASLYCYLHVCNNNNKSCVK